MCVSLRLVLIPCHIEEKADSERSNLTPKVIQHLNLSRSECKTWAPSTMLNYLPLKTLKRFSSVFHWDISPFSSTFNFFPRARDVLSLVFLSLESLECPHIQKSKFLGTWLCFQNLFFWHQDNDSVDHRQCPGGLHTQAPYKGWTFMLCVLDIKDGFLLTWFLIERLQLGAQ